MSEIYKDITPYRARELTELHKDWEPIVQKELDERVSDAVARGKDNTILVFIPERDVGMTPEMNKVIEDILVKKGWTIKEHAWNGSSRVCRIEIEW